MQTLSTFSMIYVLSAALASDSDEGGSLSLLQVRATKHMSYGTSYGTPAISYAGKECCAANGNCDQSVRMADYVTLATCQESCLGSSDCIGFEFGTGNRCQGVDSCRCFLVNGQCDNPQDHSGYNVYMNPPLPSITLPGQECCAGNGDCDQSVRVPGFITLATCQQSCLDNADCTGIEYGVGNRCTNSASCRCFMITGDCSNPKAHSGYNAYLDIKTVAAPEAPAVGDEAAAVGDPHLVTSSGATYDLEQSDLHRQ
jgi:hypothetical protein